MTRSSHSNIRKIGIVCSNTKEIRAIDAALRFYPVQDGIAYILIGEETPNTLNTKTIKIAALSAIRKPGIYQISVLKDTLPDALIYASKAAYRDFTETSSSSSMLCLGTKHSMWIYPDPEIEQTIPDWLDLSGFSFVSIGKKRRSRTMHLFADFTSYYNKCKGQEILVGDHHEAFELLFQQNTTDFVIYHPESPIPAINLLMDYVPPENSFQRVFSQMVHFENLIKHINFGTISASTKQNLQQSYCLFAQYYDSYMAHVDYDHWVEKILQWQKVYSKLSLHRIHEIACGTASIASRLVYEGYDVSASDNSVFMLHIASQKTFAPRLYNSDMLSELKEDSFDLILCLFDSINYLLHINDVGICLNRVYQALRLGGLFIFDISTLANSMDNFYDLINLTRNRDGYIVHEAYYNESDRIQTSKLTLFQKMGSTFSHHFEEHNQKVYRSYEIVQAIERSSFKFVALHSLSTKTNLLPKRTSDLDKHYHRLFYILRKD